MYGAEHFTRIESIYSKHSADINVIAWSAKQERLLFTLSSFLRLNLPLHEEPLDIIFP